MMSAAGLLLALGGLLTWNGPLVALGVVVFVGGWWVAEGDDQ